MKTFNFKDAENNMIYKVISGSKAYNLDTENSDTDIKGIYLQPNEYRLGMGYKEMISDDKNDIVYYEINRFIELLLANNPNIIEALFTPKNKILHFDDRILPLYENKDVFLTKKIKDTFGGYAISQIRKARGLNKKITKPVGKIRKDPLDFCYIFNKTNGHMIQAKKWLEKNDMKQEYVGLSKMPNAVQLYKVYYDWLSFVKNTNPKYSNIETHVFKGIISENGNEIKHSEIPKNYSLEAFLYFNKDGYSYYCREYKEYWDWVERRNPNRYNDNINNKHNYDGKNMMHCLRLLDIAIDILDGKGVNIECKNRDFLLSVKKGAIKYDEVLKLAEEKQEQLNVSFKNSKLPNDIDTKKVNDIILKIRGF